MVNSTNFSPKLYSEEVNEISNTDLKSWIIDIFESFQGNTKTYCCRHFKWIKPELQKALVAAGVNTINVESYERCDKLNEIISKVINVTSKFDFLNDVQLYLHQQNKAFYKAIADTTRDYYYVSHNIQSYGVDDEKARVEVAKEAIRNNRKMMRSVNGY